MQLGCIVISDNNQTVAFGAIKSVEKKDTHRAMDRSLALTVAERLGACLWSVLAAIAVQWCSGGFSG